MPQLTLAFSGVLIVLGVATYIGTGREHPTSLIPAVVGVLLAAAGSLALRPSMRMHAMHAAAMIGLLGFLAAAGGIIVRRPTGAALAEMLLLLIICGVFEFMCVRSFVNARKARMAGAAGV